MLMSVKREIAITCEFCCDLHLTLRVFWSKQKIPLKESEVRQEVISHKIMVMPGTQGLSSLFLSHLVA